MIDPEAASVVVIFELPSTIPPVTDTAPVVEIGASIETRAVLACLPTDIDEKLAPAKDSLGLIF